MANLGPPPRWLNCPRKGTLVGNLFVPFKVPLDGKYNEQVPLANRFDPSMVASSFRRSPENPLWVSLVIDLTNTKRFYNPEELDDLAGIRHVRVPCKGRAECPTVDQVRIFISVVKRFHSQQPLSKIGVHCTHGFNRTGFCIVAYMVEEMDCDVCSAVFNFASARPPGIYKKEYLEELVRRYGDERFDHLPVPNLPDWCLEEEEADDDNPVRNHKRSFQVPDPPTTASVDEESEVTSSSGAGAGAGGKRRRGGNDGVRKRTGGRPGSGQFMPGVGGVRLVDDADQIADVRKQTVQMVGGNNYNNFPGAQPVSMDVKNIEMLMTKSYKVSWKADGFRYMMAILGRNRVYLMDRDFNIFQVSGIDFPQRKNIDDHLQQTLLDGEMIIDEEPSGAKRPRYLIYDIIKFETQDVGQAQFKMRLFCIEREIIGPRHQNMQMGRINRDSEPFSVRLKPFWDVDVSVLQRILDGEFSKTMSHETDGLIFQPNDSEDAYRPGTCDTILKWKPPELNTIDFKLKVVRVHQEGCLPEKHGYLYVVGSDKPFGMLKVTKEIESKYDGKIVECTYDMESKQFKVLRERVDKSAPNHISTAESIAFSIMQPVTKRVLYEFINKHVTKARQDRKMMPPPPPAPGLPRGSSSLHKS